MGRTSRPRDGLGRWRFAERGLPVERDLYFKADKPLSYYSMTATAKGRIQT